MKCPDCKESMESEDASSEEKYGGFKDGKFFTRQGKRVAVRYFCPGCGEYWRWDRGYPLRRQNAGMEGR